MKLKFCIGKETKDETETYLVGSQNKHLTFYGRLPKDERNRPDLRVDGIYVDEDLVMIFTSRKDTE